MTEHLHGYPACPTSPGQPCPPSDLAYEDCQPHGALVSCEASVVDGNPTGQYRCNHSDASAAAPARKTMKKKPAAKAKPATKRAPAKKAGKKSKSKSKPKAAASRKPKKAKKAKKAAKAAKKSKPAKKSKSGKSKARKAGRKNKKK